MFEQGACMERANFASAKAESTTLRIADDEAQKTQGDGGRATGTESRKDWNVMVAPPASLSASCSSALRPLQLFVHQETRPQVKSKQAE